MKEMATPHFTFKVSSQHPEDGHVLIGNGDFWEM